MNPYKIVHDFEQAIADYAGAPYAVAVESCTAAIFLSCVYNQVQEVILPKFTYPSVPCSVIHAGGTVVFKDIWWQGDYELSPYPIVDSAMRFRRGMFAEGTYRCLSFHGKKHLPIGRGGMILTDNLEAYLWFKRARFDGRGECHLHEDKITSLGWNMYLQPEQAARGLLLFNYIKDKELKDLSNKDQGYIDLSQVHAYKQKGKS